MNILILTTNPKLYAAKGELNATLAALTEGFAQHHGYSVQVRNLAAMPLRLEHRKRNRVCALG